jgi:hypothetical protein
MAVSSTPKIAGRQCTAFHGLHRIASGELDHVVRQTKSLVDRGRSSLVIIFDDATSNVIDVDYRGTIDDVLKRVAAMKSGSLTTGAASHGPPDKDAPRGPGRPKLGVVAREVTLLPRHWDWLNTQPGGASVALRRLVDEARRTHVGKDRVRQAQEAAYKFMSAMAGDLAGFEEAARALFAGKRERYEELIAEWPTDIREHASSVAQAAWGTE